jgi:hypothetical protein
MQPNQQSSRNVAVSSFVDNTTLMPHIFSALTQQLSTIHLQCGSKQNAHEIWLSPSTETRVVKVSTGVQGDYGYNASAPSFPLLAIILLTLNPQARTISKAYYSMAT